MYPEAKYSADGTPSYIPTSVAKLVKKCKVPVVIMLHQGNHLHTPFWNWRNKRKKVPLCTKLTQIFTCASLLNFAFIPIFPIFSAGLIVFLMIFSIDYDATILNIAPYILVLGIFFISLGAFNILYKILIGPIEKTKENFALCKHQIIVCMILLFSLFSLSIYPEYIFSQLNTDIKIEQR